MADKYTPRMRQRYDDVVVKAMQEKFGYTNPMQVPKLEKITINMGVGEGSQDKKKVTTAAAEMELIRAYLNRDLNWLRGWHAAAQEMAHIEQLSSPRKVGRGAYKATAALPGKVRPLLKRRMQLCCALCGTQAGWQSGQGMQACTACGSQLFRAGNPR